MAVKMEDKTLYELIHCEEIKPIEEDLTIVEDI